VVSTRTGYAAHVGFVANVNADGSIDLISGNWARRVSDAPIPRRAIVGIVDVK
jgi:surface antigen